MTVNSMSADIVVRLGSVHRDLHLMRPKFCAYFAKTLS